MKHSPIIEDHKDMMESAREVVAIINKNGRKPLTIGDLIPEEAYTSKVDCSRPELGIETDTGTSVTSSRPITDEELHTITETKGFCYECPFRKECLAVSMTQPKVSRSTRSRKPGGVEILPGTSGAESLSLSEYLIFGGYTPQERLVIYEEVCRILREQDESNDGESK